jgi:ThiS family
MLLRFVGPFEKMTDKEISIALKKPVALAELIKLLSERYEGFRPYAEKIGDVDLSTHMAFIRQGRILKVADMLRDDDLLEVVLPATGG